MLASLSRGSDADDLARATLEDKQVTDSDVVAGDRDGVRGARSFDVAVMMAFIGWASGVARATWRVHLDVDFFVTVAAVWDLFVVHPLLVTAVNGMGNAVAQAVSGSVDSVAEGMVVPVFVVITHVIGSGFVNGISFFGVGCFVLWVVAQVSLLDVVVCERSGAATEVSLSYVDVSVVASWLFADGAELSVVSVLFRKVGVGVPRVRFSVAVGREIMLGVKFTK